MLKIICSFFLAVFFLIGFGIANAAAPIATAPASVAAPIASVNKSLDMAVKDTTVKLQLIAVKWLSALIFLQFFITNFSLLKSDSGIDGVIYKLIGSLMWFGVCFYIMENGPQFLSNVSGGFFTTASDIAGGGGTFDASDILDKGCASANDLITNVTNSASFISLVPAVIIAGLLSLVVLAVSGLIAFKVFLLKVEVMLLIMMAPLSFAFLGLNTMKDQGIAPFKSLLSLGYRIILLAVIMSAMASVGKNLDAVISSVNPTSFVSGMWQSLFGATVAYALLGFLAYKSDSMAANLSSGGTSLGTSDAGVAGAMGAAMGGAMGAALTGGASVAAGSSKAMSEVLTAMRGGLDVKNAGGSGSGGAAPQVVGSAPNASMAKPSPYPTNSAGAPTRDTPPPSGMSGGNAAPKSSSSMGAQDPAKAGAGDAAPAGSGATAGIGGAAQTPLEKQLSDLVQALQPKNEKPGFGDHMRNLNQQVQQEKNAVHVSISAHHAD